ncbi:ROK family protein [Cohnella suwonensis]|uniref:ROK family protein n=1 Tax=Cohnella suwonensis TaxID=696072 RepID=A0ABW0LNB9_9BACL
MLILEMIRAHRPVSRAEIAKRTRMSATSIGRIVGDLIEFGLVKETDQFSSGVGRKATLLDIDVQSILSVGVEVDRNIVLIGLVDLDGNIVAEQRRTIDRQLAQPESLAGIIADMVMQLAEAHGLSPSKFIGVGIGMPGIIDSAEGTAVFSAQLGWKNERFASIVEAKLGLPVVLDNDLKVKALGESSEGAMSDQGKTALISIGSGVGSALVVEGKIYRGANNIAGEIGHSTVDPNGKLCECGKRGCLQTYIADLAMLQEAGQIKPVSSVNELFSLMNAGEAWAFNIIDRACTYAAVAVSNVVCTYNPDVIILTGDFIDSNPEAFDAVSGKLKDFIWEPFAGTFELKRSKLGKKSVMIGAAKLVLQQRLDRGLRND